MKPQRFDPDAIRYEVIGPEEFESWISYIADRLLPQFPPESMKKSDLSITAFLTTADKNKICSIQVEVFPFATTFYISTFSCESLALETLINYAHYKKSEIKEREVKIGSEESIHIHEFKVKLS